MQHRSSWGTHFPPDRRLGTHASAFDRHNLLVMHAAEQSGPRPTQTIRFCTTADGVRLAFATLGAGPALVKTANWMTHVERDLDSRIWRHWLTELSRGTRVVRYDGRGCGLSDRNTDRVSFETMVEDLSAVVDAAGVDRIALLGLSQGGATAIAYAAEHPERVSHLILCGAYARGRQHREMSRDQRDESELLQSLMRVGWGKSDPEFRRFFTNRFVPDATNDEMKSFDALQLASTSPETAVRLRSAWSAIDVRGLLAKVAAPTLVAHARGDRVVPFEEGRMLAAMIPKARFVPLESRDHILLSHEPAWPAFLAEVRSFLGVGSPRGAGLEGLSARELDVLGLVAAGLDNVELATRLGLSVRTVERHLSNIYLKLNVSGKVARAAAAARYSARLAGGD